MDTGRTGRQRAVHIGSQQVRVDQRIPPLPDQHRQPRKPRDAGRSSHWQVGHTVDAALELGSQIVIAKVDEVDIGEFS